MLIFHTLYKNGMGRVSLHLDRLNGQRATRLAKRSIIAMNGLSFFRNFLFIIAVIMPYVHYKAQITPGQLLAAEAIFAISLVLFEVPSGWLADVWTRKSSLIVGILLELLGFVLMGVMNSYAVLVLSQIVIAAGLSLISGTISAMLYDTLLEIRMTRHYRRLEGLRHGLGLYAVGISGLMSGFLYAIHPELVMALSILTVFISLGFTFFLVEPKRVKEVAHANPFKDIWIAISYAVRRDPYIGRIMLFIAFTYGVTNAAFWTQQPYYMALEISIIWFGIFGAGGHILGGVFAHLSHKIGHRLSFHHTMIWVLLWLIFVYVVSAIYPSFLGICLLMTSAALYGFTFPIVQDEINQRVGSARRATLLSCVSLLARLVFSITALSVSGLLDDPSGVFDVLWILASILCLAALPAWIWLARYKN